MAGSTNVPASVASGLICLVLGIGVGAIGYDYYKERAKADGSDTEFKPPENGGPQAAMAGRGPGGPPGMGGPGGGPGMGGPGGGPGMGGPGRGGPGGAPGGPGGGRGPSPKMQLARLVSTLDALTGQPLELSDEQKKLIHEQIQGLAEMDELSDEEAGKRLQSLTEALQDHKARIELAGFRFPGGAPPAGGGFGAPPPANPFKDDAGNKSVKSLASRLAQD